MAMNECENELKEEIKRMVDGIDASWTTGKSALLMTFGFVRRCMLNSDKNGENALIRKDVQ